MHCHHHVFTLFFYNTYTKLNKKKSVLAQQLLNLVFGWIIIILFIVNWALHRWMYCTVESSIVVAVTHRRLITLSCTVTVRESLYFDCVHAIFVLFSVHFSSFLIIALIVLSILTAHLSPVVPINQSACCPTTSAIVSQGTASAFFLSWPPPLTSPTHPSSYTHNFMFHSFPLSTSSAPDTFSFPVSANS